jgi:hypothetical protein
MCGKKFLVCAAASQFAASLPPVAGQRFASPATLQTSGKRAPQLMKISPPRASENVTLDNAAHPTFTQENTYKNLSSPTINRMSKRTVISAVSQRFS